MVREQLDETVGHRLGIEVEESHPAHALHVGHAPHQRLEVVFRRKIAPVGNRVLRDEVDLEGACGGECFDLAHDVVDGARSLFSA
jgi:hypothetical protein